MLRGCKIFVSYSFTDDYPTGKIQDGWVSRFVMYLHEMLKQVMKAQDFEFYMEHAGHINSDVITERNQKLLNADILLVVTSPNYISSKSSHTLLDAYHTHINKSGVTSHQKIFKVVKFPISISNQPTNIRPLIDYQFYTTNKTTGEADEIDNYFGQEAKTAFWLPLTDLCFEVKKIIEKKGTLTPSEDKGKYVFLAITGTDLEAERATIKRELERRNFQVLPSKAISGDEEEITRSVKQDLKRSILSIHLIGNRSSNKPEESETTFVEIQNKLAAEHTKICIEEGKNYPRLIWIAAEEKHIEEKQKFYIEQLKRNRELQLGADILQTQIEDFKSAILNYLAANLAASFKSTFNGLNAGKIIYLITDKRDVNQAQNLAHKLAQLGFEVMISSFDRRKSNSRRTHQELLNKCDIAFVLFFEARKEWLVSKLQDIIKSAGMGRKRPFDQQVILSDKADLQVFLNELTFIDNFSLNYQLIITKDNHDFKEVDSFFNKLAINKSDSLIA